METELKSIQQILETLQNTSLPVWGGLLLLVLSGLVFMILRSDGKRDTQQAQRDSQLMGLFQALVTGQNTQITGQNTQIEALKASEETNHSILTALTQKLDYHTTEANAVQQTILSALESVAKSQKTVSEQLAATIRTIEERNAIQQRMDTQEQELAEVREENSRLRLDLQQVKDELACEIEARKTAEAERDATKNRNAELDNKVYKLTEKVNELERELKAVKKDTGELKGIEDKGA